MNTHLNISSHRFSNRNRFWSEMLEQTNGISRRAIKYLVISTELFSNPKYKLTCLLNYL